jgi:hypothetical protein
MAFKTAALELAGAAVITAISRHTSTAPYATAIRDLVCRAARRTPSTQIGIGC